MRYIDIGWLKFLICLTGIVAIIAAIVMAIAVPTVKYYQFERSINTYYEKAGQAATPDQFVTSLSALNEALRKSGMETGSVDLVRNAPQDKMTYKQDQYALLASRAQTMVGKDLSSADVNTGLGELKTTLSSIPTSTYGYWFWNQGGIWWQLWCPLILFAGGVIGIIVAALMPEYIARKVRVKAKPVA